MTSDSVVVSVIFVQMLLLRAAAFGVVVVAVVVVDKSVGIIVVSIMDVPVVLDDVAIDY
jgi:hypothetical protein